jgi:hypothetical protein
MSENHNLDSCLCDNFQSHCVLFSVPRRSVGDGLLLIYLQILASLTVNISKVYTGSNGRTVHTGHETSGDSGDDSDSEMDHEDSSNQELQVSASTSRLLNATTTYLQNYLIKKKDNCSACRFTIFV